MQYSVKEIQERADKAMLKFEELKKEIDSLYNEFLEIDDMNDMDGVSDLIENGGQFLEDIEMLGNMLEVIDK